MTMLLITKRFAEAIVASALVFNDCKGMTVCIHCKCEATYSSRGWICTHNDDCVVYEAKLLLEKEWGITNGA